MVAVRSVAQALWALLFVGVVAWAGPADPPAPIPRLPAYGEFPLLLEQHMVATRVDNGDFLWVAAASVDSKSHDSCWHWRLRLRRWNPTTGAHGEQVLGFDGVPFAQTAVRDGILFYARDDCAVGNPARLGLVTLRGELLAFSSVTQFDTVSPYMLTLGDDAAVILVRKEPLRHMQAYVLRRTGKTVTVEAMPELAVSYRNDFAAVALDARRLMVLGGSNGSYRGCMECRAETYILDVAAKRWQPGPPMLEARSEHAATRLPDGSVLVTGGWTRKADWGPGPSRTAERWNPVSNRFEAVAPMPTGNARHRGLWLPGQEGRILAMAQGMSNSLPAYDVTAGTWFNAAAWWQGSEEGGCAFLPFALEGQSYAWNVLSTEGYYSSKSCGTIGVSSGVVSLSTLRMPAAVASAPLRGAPESLLLTYRSGAAFVPASGDLPALSIGGTTHAGMNSALVTATVEAVDQAGRLLPMPSLNEARVGATAFRLGDGVLVVGGIVGSIYDRHEGGRKLLAEWLASARLGTTAHWERVELDEGGPATTQAVYARLADGSLLRVGNGGEVARLVFERAPSGFALRREAWPVLPRARSSSEKAPVRVRQLSDGRIVVTGGEVQVERIALYSAEPGTQGAGAVARIGKDEGDDQYVGIGAYLPARRHDIYDPATGRWRMSAPSTLAGGQSAVLDDGRVVRVAPATGNSAGYAMEMSDAAGGRWSRLSPSALPTLKLDDQLGIHMLDGEMFATGVVEGIDSGGGATGLEWFDAAHQRWVRLWQAEPHDNWRDHVGRMVVRKLANGKVVVLPVEGW